MENIKVVQSTAIATIIGAVSALACTLAYIADPALAYMTAGSGLLTRIAMALSFALISTGIYGLWHSGAVDQESGIVKIGFAMSTFGLLVVIGFVFTRNNVLAIASAAILGIGMIMIGMAVLQADRWQSWRKFIPLIYGLAPLGSIFLYPVADSVSPGTPDHLLSIINLIIWMLFGIALWMESNQDSLPTLTTVA